jgi:hypothetical protein
LAGVGDCGTVAEAAELKAEGRAVRGNRHNTPFQIIGIAKLLARPELIAWCAMTAEEAATH